MHSIDPNLTGFIVNLNGIPDPKHSDCPFIETHKFEYVCSLGQEPIVHLFECSKCGSRISYLVSDDSWGYYYSYDCDHIIMEEALE